MRLFSDLQTATREQAENPRAKRLFDERFKASAAGVDSLMVKLMVIQWFAGIFVAWTFSPYAWAGREAVLHTHVVAAVGLGSAIVSLPIYLGLKRPGEVITRNVMAAAQMLFGALLIHLSGGRIETHFHIFGSLAILAFYRDLKVLIPASLIVAADHFLRGVIWPESIYGVANPEWWRFLEHAGWVAFIDIFLFLNCARAFRELWDLCVHYVDLDESRDALGRSERLAAIGQLAASVGHELRNPLAAIRNAEAYISTRLASSDPASLHGDKKIETFLGLMRRELEASNQIISNLLDFSRTKEPRLAPCPLAPLVDEALGVIPEREGIAVLNEVSVDFPVASFDRNQFRQVLVNLSQNAVEAFADGQDGTVRVTATHNDEGWTMQVSDDGPGMNSEVVAKVFAPLYSTKAKGTGLGLAIVSGIIEQHGGTLSVESSVGEGTTFTATLPHDIEAAVTARGAS